MNRATAATGMNEGSSRSHSVFTVTGNWTTHETGGSLIQIFWTRVLTYILHFPSLSVIFLLFLSPFITFFLLFSFVLLLSFILLLSTSPLLLFPLSFILPPSLSFSPFSSLSPFLSTSLFFLPLPPSLLLLFPLSFILLPSLLHLFFSESEGH